MEFGKSQLVSDFNQKHPRPVLFERGFKVSNCSCKVDFTTEIYKFSFLNCKSTFINSFVVTTCFRAFLKLFLFKKMKSIWYRVAQDNSGFLMFG